MMPAILSFVFCAIFIGSIAIGPYKALEHLNTVDENANDIWAQKLKYKLAIIFIIVFALYVWYELLCCNDYFVPEVFWK